jgi:hypothetical protein
VHVVWSNSCKIYYNSAWPGCNVQQGTIYLECAEYFRECDVVGCSLFFQYAAKEFGTCPLVQCAGQPVLPVGLKDEMGADTVKIFCPKCQCVYHPPPIRSRGSHHGGAGAAGVDGAAFGTTFPHLFLMTFSNLVPDRLPSDSAYVPRVFGFRVHSSARQRASGAASGLVPSSNSRPREGAENAKRPSFTRRSSDPPTKDAAERRPKEEDSLKASAGQDGLSALPAQDAANDGQKGSKGTTSTSSNKAKGVNDENSTKDAKDEDANSKKSKTGKRRNEGDAISKKSDGNGNGVVDTTSKRRRKSDNGNS